MTDPTMVDPNSLLWIAYDQAAEWVARNAEKVLAEEEIVYPPNADDDVKALIDSDPEAFLARCKAMAYGIAMEKLNLPEDPEN